MQRRTPPANTRISTQSGTDPKPSQILSAHKKFCLHLRGERPKGTTNQISTMQPALRSRFDVRFSTSRRLVRPVHARKEVSEKYASRENVSGCNRRLIGTALLVVPLLSWSVADPAFAGFNKSAKEYAAAAKARKEKLKAAADAMKSKGKTADAFEESKYSLPEESRTPNLRTLADDRLREE